MALPFRAFRLVRQGISLDRFTPGQFAPKDTGADAIASAGQLGGCENLPQSFGWNLSQVHSR
jgi:hypothetical protein